MDVFKSQITNYLRFRRPKESEIVGFIKNIVAGHSS